MRTLRSIFLVLSIAALGVLDARDAEACGGCAVSQSENSQVTGHRMILSISQTSTTLWDQITYSGDPKDFGWMLPVKGSAGFDLNTDFNLSSDALFNVLEQITQVTIRSPVINCPPPPVCPDDDFFAAGVSSSNGAGGGGGGGVTVIAEKVAGPFQIVHLQATVPDAMKDWLAMNDYVVPPEAGAIIDGYVAEQFDFIAVKLVPGQGVSSMRPVRIKMPGASPTLPLRMVGVGTGAVTAMTLWVTGEGRYEPANFPSFEIKEADLVWNWDTSSSNYKELRQKGYDASNGKAWIVESSDLLVPYEIEYQLQSLVAYDPLESGYGDELGNGAEEELAGDLEALYGSLDPAWPWLTRLSAELPRSALATDLSLGASLSQDKVSRSLQATKTIGTAPVCPPAPECSDPSGGSGGANGSLNQGSQSCAMGNQEQSSIALTALALGAALAFTRRRRPRTPAR